MPYDAAAVERPLLMISFRLHDEARPALDFARLRAGRQMPERACAKSAACFRPRPRWAPPAEREAAAIYIARFRAARLERPAGRWHAGGGYYTHFFRRMLKCHMAPLCAARHASRDGGDDDARGRACRILAKCHSVPRRSFPLALPGYTPADCR